MKGASATLALTGLAMAAFAANSLLCRLALIDAAIDPASFTAIRIVAGAVTLALIASLRGGIGGVIAAGSWRGGAALFAYAAAFSFAYVTLGASTGALILFGAVQISMIGAGLLRGEGWKPLQWFGALAAACGLIYLLAPGVQAPSPAGAALMFAAGLAWGAYSLTRSAHGQRFDATIVTAGNFLRATPMALALLAPFAASLNASLYGVVLAVASGALASGLGYAVWYAALKGLRASDAAIVQLTVPVIAASVAVLLLNEPLSWRFVIASAAVLGGVWLVLSVQTNSDVRRAEPGDALDPTANDPHSAKTAEK